MIPDILENIKTELVKGTTVKGHPFRLCVMATVGINNSARIRTVVLRDVDEHFNLTFYTDKRTKKVTHIRENRNVSLLFYHPDLKTQVRIEGFAKVEEKEKAIRGLWDKLHDDAKKDYTSAEAPGTKIGHPDFITHLKDEHYFTVIRVLSQKIDYFELKPHKHVRAAFSLEDNNKWNGTYLVP
ncbi:pyridoxamine 5'-phosphate oxidase family protein [Zhouia spongiae]|uniref:Pyridoxamine 5'-phosphate oxidase family protein n=1 Tax=Zhouia spongiae TaxID=2202721 RepID=A0ABY3YM14_9FLAO|nr:pyridoxamine 5'-phosphate oxidase family protein [Zhouia spongiae]UNY98857.1 pyridoxamine 5'-phosphate oxidase family protein [Zhouia spongiae]